MPDVADIIPEELKEGWQAFEQWRVARQRAGIPLPPGAVFIPALYFRYAAVVSNHRGANGWPGTSRAAYGSAKNRLIGMFGLPWCVPEARVLKSGSVMS